MLMRYLTDRSYGWQQHDASSHLPVPILFLFGSLDALMFSDVSVAFSDTFRQTILRLASKFFWSLACLLIFIHGSYPLDLSLNIVVKRLGIGCE